MVTLTDRFSCGELRLTILLFRKNSKLLLHSVLYVPYSMLLCIVVSILDGVETSQHIISEVLLVFSFRQLDNRSRLFTCLFEDAYQTELVLNTRLSAILASLGTLGAVDPLDDPNNVLMVSGITGHVKNHTSSYLIMFVGCLPYQFSTISYFKKLFYKVYYMLPFELARMGISDERVRYDIFMLPLCGY